MSDEVANSSPSEDHPPPPRAPVPVIPIEEEDAATDVESEAAAAASPPPPADDSLAELAQAEAELEAMDAGDFPGAAGSGPSLLRYAGPTRAARRAAKERGNAAWGIISFWLAVFCWSFLLLGFLVASRGRVGSRIAGLSVANAFISSFAAIVFGTIGRRRPAARKRAIAGRFMAWMTPGVVTSFLWAVGAFQLIFVRGYLISGPNSLTVVAMLVLEALVGLFIFTFIDAVLE